MDQIIGWINIPTRPSKRSDPERIIQLGKYEVPLVVLLLPVALLCRIGGGKKLV